MKHIEKQARVTDSLAELLFRTYQGSVHRTLRWDDLDEQSRLSWEMDAEMIRGYLVNARGWKQPEVAE